MLEVSLKLDQFETNTDR
jgi:hypothetical protein